MKQTKKETDRAKEIARLYYAAGHKQAEIADKVGVARATVGRWAAADGWDVARAAKTVSRREIVNKMLAKLNSRLDDTDWTPDELAKVAAAIDKLDKKTNVVTIIEVFGAYNNFLTARMRLDPELTPELVNIMTRYQDIFINENFSATSVEFK